MIDEEKIQELIKEYLPVREIEKKKYGEVFTPQSLINEMLDKLPQSVWTDPNLKWLDPANGIGNFSMLIFSRLDKGLANVFGFEKRKKRQRHIIENMLYMVELNHKNVGVSRKIFGKRANIYCGSFLEDEWKEEFGLDKFDIIVGNPPFNKERKKIVGTTAGKVSLWDKFVINSFEVLNTNGYLGFIHPANWRGANNKLWDIMSEKQILYLRIYSQKDGKEIFNVGSRFDLYVLKNKENTKPTEVIDELGEKHLLKLNEIPFLPNYAYKEIKKILNTKDKGIDVIYSRSLYGTDKSNMNKTKTSEDKGIDVIYDTNYHTTTKNPNTSNNKTSEYKYPVVHSINRNGLGLWYSNTNTKGHFGVSKVILNKNAKQYSYPEQNDYEGKYGMTELSFGIPIKSKSEGDLILKAIETPIFKKIIASTKWGAFQTNYRMFKYFRPDFYKIIIE